MVEGRETRRKAVSRPVIAAIALGVAIGAFAASISRSATNGAVIRQTMPEAQVLALPQIATPGRTDSDAPLVVLDAGHGGFDPGASGAKGVTEKRIVLALALAVRERLLVLGGVRVALTRERDVFLPLEERTALAEALDADAFVSIHADSAPSDTARGANVYVLAARASDRDALAVARHNNRNAAGAEAMDGGTNDVDAILGELTRRETALESARLAEIIDRAAAGRLPVHKPFRRGARFVVLRSTEMPSVLFEAGYVSNPDDAARLTGAEGQAAIAGALADSIVRFLLAPATL